MEENKSKNKMDKKKAEENSRRNFIKVGLGVGVASVASMAAVNIFSNIKVADAASGEKIKVLTTDGKLVEIDKDQVKDTSETRLATRKEARQGIHGRKFVMVIDLAKCKNARACVAACQQGHHLPKSQEWMKVFLMQDSDESAPYWFPRPCFHCDNPMCASVCPVGATYKRSDGIVLIDNERCIGCKFCMTGCPYSVRVFNWKHYPELDEVKREDYSPETNVPGLEGTVGKCIFCADIIKEGQLPRCVQACPMGVIYFGDLIEDAVSNGTETIRFTKLVENKGAFRYLEQLGTEPSVYYLPPTDRQFPFDRGLEDLDPDIEKRYINTPYFKNKNKKI
jgi:Fe-S-cluster-containing dehydrogenase component